MSSATTEASPIETVREQSVRSYIDFLADPASLVNLSRVVEIESALTGCTDTIERLRLLGTLEREKSPDGSAVLENFIKDAKLWADASGVPARVFLSLGVSEDVLRRAGWSFPARTGTPRKVSSSPAKRVTAAQVKEWAMSQPEAFSLKDVKDVLGCSLMTASKAVRELVADGELMELAPQAKRSGPGRNPTRFMHRAVAA